MTASKGHVPRPIFGGIGSTIDRLGQGVNDQLGFRGKNRFGYEITFSIERDADETFNRWIRYQVQEGDTVAKIAAAAGHPEETVTIAKHNGIRSIHKTLKTGTVLQLPGYLKPGDAFSVLPQDMLRPVVIDGYALFQIVSRPGTIGINQFTGYNPLSMTLNLDFITHAGYTSDQLESDCQLLERMAGRGKFKGAASGAPPVIRIGVENSAGKMIPIIPINYQWSPQSPSAPLWRIGGASGTTGIDWDQGALGNSDGKRRRQLATVTVSQYTPIVIAERSASTRANKRHGKTSQQG